MRRGVYVLASARWDVNLDLRGLSAIFCGIDKVSLSLQELLQKGYEIY